MASDNFGDRMKLYEAAEAARKFMPLLPIVVRIDGKNFKNFTRHMSKPFDDKFISCMQQTTEELVRETCARIGYCQSDEITLIFQQSAFDSEIYFNGKIQKLVSVIASLTTGYFIQAYMTHFGEFPKKLPAFDTRAFQVPDQMEAVNQLRWRVQDATKNAIMSAARSLYSHRELNGKNTSEMQEMMWVKGINFNDYSPDIKEGSFFQRKTVWLPVADELTPVPPYTGTIMAARTKIQKLNMPIFSKIKNITEVVFDQVDPLV
jgi:tRNA(His) 5'-end guanylyltransferase